MALVAKEAESGGPKHERIEEGGLCDECGFVEENTGESETTESPVGGSRASTHNDIYRAEGYTSSSIANLCGLFSVAIAELTALEKK